MREVWKILEMKLLNNYSNVQISNIVWLSAERVRQIIEKHLWKLQKHLIKNWYWY
jgi:DNA-directed RNA polymerase sigma subunit (sigma70/sigma32)